MRHTKPVTLSDRPLQVYKYLQAYQAEHHYSPSIREIMLHINSGSTSYVIWVLEKLEEGGWIKRDPHVSRSIVVVKND